MLRTYLVLATLAASAAHADPTPVASEEQRRSREPVTPQDNETPQPVTAPQDQVSGVATEDAPPATNEALWIPRTLLFLPKVAFWVVAQPIRGAAYAYEHYDLRERATEATFNKKRTFGIYPVATYESGFGFNAGARLLWRNILGEQERMKLRANFGGRYSQAAGINLRSGHRLGERVTLEIDSSFEKRPSEHFYGIGNNDVAAMPPASLISPVDSTAVSTRFREDLFRNVLGFDAWLGGNFYARLSGALMYRKFSGTDEPNSITNYYDVNQLVGFNEGTNNVYIEQELRYDTRKPSEYGTSTIDVTGWLLSVHGGATSGVENDASQFYTYGGEIQRYFDLYDGSRSLALRVLFESVAGTDGRTDGKISFIDLPRLGGAEYLRGYPNGRFRDRAVTLGSAEYTWDIGNYLAACTFVDVGRPWSSFQNVDLGGLRMGFGGGIQVHSTNTYLLRTQLAASRDGDLFLELALQPAFGRRERAGRF